MLAGEVVDMLARLVLCVVLFAGDGAAQSAAVERFGALPMRFNGRMSTVDEFARHLLWRMGDAPVALDPDGRELAPSEWLLDVLAWHPRARRDRWLHLERALLVLRFGAGEELGAPPYGFDELAALARDPKSPLHHLLRPYALLSAAHEGAGSGEPVDPQAWRERLETLSSQLLPRLLPVREEDGRWSWRTWPELCAQGRAELPVAQAFGAVLRAHREDPGALLERVEAFEALLPPPQERTAPLDYRTPEGWQMLGAPLDLRPEPFFDVGGLALPVASFHVPGRDCTGGVVFAQDPTRTDEELVDAWRMRVGLLPRGLADGEAGERRVAVEAGGRALTGVEVETPPGWPRRARGLGVVIRGERAAWVVTLMGPRIAMKREAERFWELVRSLRVEPELEAARAWFGYERAPQAEPRLLTAELVFATVDARTWMLSCVSAKAGRCEELFDVILPGVVPALGSDALWVGAAPGIRPERHGPSWQVEGGASLRAFPAVAEERLSELAATVARQSGLAPQQLERMELRPTEVAGRRLVRASLR